MQKKFHDNSHITMREIIPDDWDAYKAFHKHASPLHFAPYFNENGIDTPDMKDKFFNGFLQPENHTVTLFGLFNDNNIIGQTTIRFFDKEKGPQAIFGGSDIAPDYQRRGLADNLYDHRKAYLKEIGFSGDVFMTIASDNKESQEAAARNGFVKTGSQQQDGKDFDILKPAPLTSP